MTEEEMLVLANKALRHQEMEKKKRGRYLAAMSSDPKDPRHGTHRGYVYGCRCKRCVKANADYSKEYRKRGKVC